MASRPLSNFVPKIRRYPQRSGGELRGCWRSLAGSVLFRFALAVFVFPASTVFLTYRALDWLSTVFICTLTLFFGAIFRPRSCRRKTHPLQDIITRFWGRSHACLPGLLLIVFGRISACVCRKNLTWNGVFGSGRDHPSSVHDQSTNPSKVSIHQPRERANPKTQSMKSKREDC